MSSLHADERGDLPTLMNPHDIRRGMRELKLSRIATRHTLHEVDLLERRLNRCGRSERGGHIDRPKLGAYAPRAETIEVGPNGVSGLQIRPRPL